MNDNVFSTEGRIGRGGWWLVQLALLGGWLFVIFAFSVAAAAGAVAIAALIFAVAFVGLVWLNIASTIKRFHDRGKSWVWMFIAFVPIIGPIWQIVELGFFPGSPYDNEYGPGRGGKSGSAFENARAEIEGKNRGRSPAVWEQGATATIDKTAAALRANEKRHGVAAGAPRASFGQRGN